VRDDTYIDSARPSRSISARSGSQLRRAKRVHSSNAALQVDVALPDGIKWANIDQMGACKCNKLEMTVSI
jgi:hypothetical protein